MAIGRNSLVLIEVGIKKEFAGFSDVDNEKEFTGLSEVGNWRGGGGSLDLTRLEMGRNSLVL